MHFTLAADDLAVGAWLSQEQLLGQAVENLANMPQTTAVEAESLAHTKRSRRDSAGRFQAIAPLE